MREPSLFDPEHRNDPSAPSAREAAEVFEQAGPSGSSGQEGHPFGALFEDVERLVTRLGGLGDAGLEPALRQVRARLERARSALAAGPAGRIADQVRARPLAAAGAAALAGLAVVMLMKRGRAPR
jgi:hypothetical protein